MSTHEGLREGVDTASAWGIRQFKGQPGRLGCRLQGSHGGLYLGLPVGSRLHAARWRAGRDRSRTWVARAVDMWMVYIEYTHMHAQPHRNVHRPLCDALGRTSVVDASGTASPRVRCPLCCGLHQRSQRWVKLARCVSPLLLSGAYGCTRHTERGRGKASPPTGVRIHRLCLTRRSCSTGLPCSRSPRRSCLLD